MSELTYLMSVPRPRSQGPRSQGKCSGWISAPDNSRPPPIVRDTAASRNVFLYESYSGKEVLRNDQCETTTNRNSGRIPISARSPPGRALDERRSGLSVSRLNELGSHAVMKMPGRLRPKMSVKRGSCLSRHNPEVHEPARRATRAPRDPPTVPQAPGRSATGPPASDDRPEPAPQDPRSSRSPLLKIPAPQDPRSSRSPLLKIPAPQDPRSSRSPLLKINVREQLSRPLIRAPCRPLGEPHSPNELCHKRSAYGFFNSLL